MRNEFSLVKAAIGLLSSEMEDFTLTGYLEGRNNPKP